MKLSIFQADAFAGDLFSGNPAAVIPLDSWLPDRILQNIAMENNLSETAFFVSAEAGFHLRWFTPTTEVSLCGHATLATAHVLFNHLDYSGETVSFNTRGGQLSVFRRNNLLCLDFPVAALKTIPTPQGLTAGLGLRPLEVLQGSDYLMAVYKNESEIRKIEPNFTILAKLPFQGIIVTATGTDSDFVSRFFAPVMGIPEDPVTGSAHILLIPFWSKLLGKSTLLAHQVSRRGGILYCELLGDRVIIGGKAVTFMQGTIIINDPD